MEKRFFGLDVWVRWSKRDDTLAMAFVILCCLPDLATPSQIGNARPFSGQDLRLEATEFFPTRIFLQALPHWMLTSLFSISTRISFFPISKHTSAKSIYCTSFRFFHSMESLTASLARLGVKSLPAIPSAHPDQNPLDIFRTHIAERLAPLAGVEQAAIFAGLDRATKPDSGEFILAVPRLRIRGAEPNELSKKWQAEVYKTLPPFSSYIC